MNLLDRFSTHLREVLAGSIRLAAELKNPLVEPIHLFFSLATQKGSVAAEIINRFKINPKTLEQALLNLPTVGRNNLARGTVTATEAVLTALSPKAKAALEKAIMVAQENRHNYIGSEHLLAGLLRLNDALISDVLRVNGAAVTELQKQLETVLLNATQFPQITEAAEVVEHIQENLGEIPGGEFSDSFGLESKRGRKKESSLDFFAVNLTGNEAQTNIDPVIGREVELERLIQILARRTKNNPVLLGEPGVGKTAIVEGLAKRIVEGTVPDILLNKKIYSLDLGMLIAGTIYRGEFEARIRQVIEEVSESREIILFIDEIHNIVGAGSNQGTMDAANILKPALARGAIRCIGATTPAEFKKYIESDAALERRFQPILVKESSVADSIKILTGIKENYERYHRVAITPEAIAAAVNLADRYISNKFLPDKAIDLLDETAAAKRLTAKTSTAENRLWRLKHRLEKATLAKEAAAGNDQFAEAVKFKELEKKLRTEIANAEKKVKTKTTKLVGAITDQDLVEQVAKIIGTSPAELLLDDATPITSLEDRLKEYIVGQNQVITEVSQLVRQARLGLSSPERPLASFLFVGESGVGKTELAKTLAKLLYPGKESFIKLDMSEFSEGFGISKLLGAPAGYIGYKESNQFSDRIKMNPHCVVLFDEIDKAHKDVVKLLLQILENGEITDSAGKKISLKHAIIILTTSLGAAESKKSALGFGTSVANNLEAKTRLVEKLKEYFSPEIINRLDATCLFEPLTSEMLVKIAELELNRFNERLRSYRTSVSADQKTLEWLVGQNKKNGAREVRRQLRSAVEALIAGIILEHQLKDKYRLTVQDNQLAVR